MREGRKPWALARRIGWRLLAGVGVMWGAATICFLTLHLTAGDIALATIAGEGANPQMAVLEQVRRDYGLDLPIWQQYLNYLGKLLEGDLGQSYQRRLPVAQAITQQLPGTVALTVAATIIAVVLAVVVAVLTARRGPLTRTLTGGTELVLASMPTFVVGLVLLIVFALHLNWFPTSGAKGLESLVLPAFTLALPIAAVLAQVLRSELEDVLEQPFILTARSRGMTELAVRLRHALRHASMQLVTMSGFVIAGLLGGAVITEAMFNRQGVGQLMLSATTNKDVPLVMGVVLMSALVHVVVNLLVDIGYTFADPRVVAR